MSISNQADLDGMQKASDAVAVTLRKMREYAQPGISTLELDLYGRTVLESFGAKSAPKLTYGFPGWTCISLNHEVAHGIPSAKNILKEGDLVNIDVSAELGGYWADNGGSFVLGNDIHGHAHLVNTSKQILYSAIHHIRDGVRIADLGGYIESEARKAGYKVIKNLVGHGIGRSLHEEPKEIPCFYDAHNKKYFRKNAVVAIETFISTRATWAHPMKDGWTLATKDKSYVVQHEHTIVVTDNTPLVLTGANQIWN
jgi:methionyl aminopeptidase